MGSAPGSTAKQLHLVPILQAAGAAHHHLVSLLEGATHRHLPAVPKEHGDRHPVHRERLAALLHLIDHASLGAEHQGIPWQQHGVLLSHRQRHPHWRADDEGARFRLEAQLDEPGLGIGARRPLVIDGVAAELLPFHPQPGLGGQLPGPGNRRTQPDVRLVRIDQLKRLFARIHMLPRLDEVLVHHTIERREDAASAQLLLNLAHLHPRQLLGQLSLLHVIARLVILALGGTLLLVQTIQALELGAIDFVAKPKIGVADGLRQLSDDITDKIIAEAADKYAFAAKWTGLKVE